MPAFMIKWQRWVVVTNWWPPKPEVLTVWLFTEKILLTLHVLKFKTFPLCVSRCVCVFFKQQGHPMCFCSLSLLWNVVFTSNFCWIIFLFVCAIEVKPEDHTFLFMFALHKSIKCYLGIVVVIIIIMVFTVSLRIDFNCWLKWKSIFLTQTMS